MLYNDIAIDGLIKRAARQAAVETVYMLKQAEDANKETVAEALTDLMVPGSEIARKRMHEIGLKKPELITDDERKSLTSSQLFSDANINKMLGKDPLRGTGYYAMKDSKDETSDVYGIDRLSKAESPSAWDSILEHLANNAFTYGGGIGGAGIGALLGDNPNQKLLYALLGGGGGAGLGALADYLRK